MPLETRDYVEEDIPQSEIDASCEEYDPESVKLSEWKAMRLVQTFPGLQNSIINSMWSGIGLGFGSFLFTKNAYRSVHIGMSTIFLSCPVYFTYYGMQHNNMVYAVEQKNERTRENSKAALSAVENFQQKELAVAELGKLLNLNSDASVEDLESAPSDIGLTLPDLGLTVSDLGSASSEPGSTPSDPGSASSDPGQD